MNSEQQWWLSNQGTPSGPHSEGYVLAGLQTGTISPQTYACPVGGQEWKRLIEWPSFAATAAAVPPPVPLTPPPLTVAPGVSRAWNPVTVALLGIAFSPVWAGIMAAINTKRLGVTLPLWRPVAIGVGATILDILISSMLGDSLILDLVLYLGALALIWHIDIKPQIQSFRSRQIECGQQASWLVPGLAGSPLALLVLFGFVVSPLLPLQPRDVCQRFVNARSLNEAKRYTTTKLWPALAAMYGEKDDPDFKSQFELTAESAGPPELGGYVVGWRLYGESKGERGTTEGFFHLVNYGGPWKIEEWYFTAYNQERAESPMALSVAYPQLFPAVRNTPAMESSSPSSTPKSNTTASAPTSAKPKEEEPYLVKSLPSQFRGIGGWVYRWLGTPGLVIFTVIVAFILYSMMYAQKKNG
jgi:hypothetical protein